MITVLLADDETSFLHSLTRNIDWDKLQLRLLGCVSNGQEALEQIQKNMPDILITDIAMPIMSGLDLAQYIYENRLPIKVIIISGHQEFQYAQRGLQYNVTNYLIKPCEKQQLNEQLKELCQLCIHEKKELLEKQRFEAILNSSKPILRERMLLDLIQGVPITEKGLAEKCSFLELSKENRYYVVAAEIDAIEEDFKPLKEKQKIFTALHMSEALSSNLAIPETAISLSLSEGYYVLLIPEDAADNIVSLCNLIRGTFYSYTGLSTTYGIGGPAVGLLELGAAYQRASETLLYKYLAGKNTVICYEDITATTTSEQHVANTLALQTKIIRGVKAGDTGSIDPLCEELFDTLKNCSPELIKSLIIQLIASLSAALIDSGESLTELFGDDHILLEKVLRFETIFDVKLWLCQILTGICEYIKEKNQKNAHRLAQKAARYIDEHYMENLNVDTIAAKVYLSSGYLMTIFTKELGQSIGSYLTMRRIDRAKELLLEDQLKIYEIAQEVGYANTTFFSSTFRNHTGLSPRQYKEKYLLNLI